MTTRRGLLCGLGAAPLALASREDEGAPAALESWSVFLVRHAEKGTDDPRDPQLSAAGKERAAALADLLAAAGVTRVLSTDYRRTRATALPLAEQADVATELYDPRDPNALVETLTGSKHGSVTVVVGHSNTTPIVLQHLGAPEPAGLEDSSYGRILPEDCYDRLYLAHFVRLAGADEPRFAGSLELRYGN
jgi:phosphohistidine phosphatase SixA